MFFALHLIIPLCFIIFDIVRIEYGIKIFQIHEVDMVFYVFLCFIVLHIHHYIKLYKKLRDQKKQRYIEEYCGAITFSIIVVFISYLMLLQAGKSSI
jgi:hypothetical protein